jgi:hypothetical protein
LPSLAAICAEGSPSIADGQSKAWVWLGAETSWETWIEAQIHVATEDGAFDNLPGAGKPNYGPDDNPLARWVKRQVGDEQFSVLPPSLELLRRVHLSP